MSAEFHCPFCGNEALIEVFDIWTDHSFLMETCCEGLNEAVNEELAEDAQASRGRSGSPWIRAKIEQAIGRPLRRVADDDGHLILDYALDVRPVKLSEAKDFVRKHHAHVKPPAGWKFGASIWNGGSTQIGVIMVGRPVSRMLDQKGDTLEVNRLCLNRDLPDPLRWNACSQLYAWAAREAEKRGYGRIITYLRDDEDGVSVKAAGWVAEHKSAGGSWDRKDRGRASENTVPKIRWAKSLKPKVRMPLLKAA